MRRMMKGVADTARRRNLEDALSSLKKLRLTPMWKMRQSGKKEQRNSSTTKAVAGVEFWMTISVIRKETPTVIVDSR